MKLLKKNDKYFRFIPEGGGIITPPTDIIVPIEDETSLLKWVGSGKNPADFCEAGDIISINFNNIYTEFAIIGLNHTTYNINPYNITIQPKKIPDGVDGRMNSSETDGGWGACEARTWCNNDFKNMINNESLRNAIQEVDVPYCATYNQADLSTSKDYCFLLSYAEVFGNESFNGEPKNKEGIQFKYYMTQANRSKTGGAYSLWWLRSSISNDFGYFCIVGPGFAGNNHPNDLSISRVPACVFSA